MSDCADPSREDTPSPASLDLDDSDLELPDEFFGASSDEDDGDLPLDQEGSGVGCPTDPFDVSSDNEDGDEGPSEGVNALIDMSVQSDQPTARTTDTVSSPALLTPHNLPPELLHAIMTLLPDRDIYPLTLVNSAWRAVARPRFYSVVHIPGMLRFSGPRPGQLDLLAKTHTLDVRQHTARDCERLRPLLPDLPSLHTLRLPMITHAGDNTPCAFLSLRFDTLVHTGLTLDPTPARDVPRPPSDFRVRNYVLEFDGEPDAFEVREIKDDRRSGAYLFSYEPWLEARPSVAEHVVAILRREPYEQSAPLRIAFAVLQRSRPTPAFTIVGGSIEHKYRTTQLRGIATANRLPLDDVSPSYKILIDGEDMMETGDHVRLGLCRGLLRPPHALKEEFATRGEWVEWHDRFLLSCKVRVRKLEEVLASGELDDVVSRDEIRRVVQGEGDWWWRQARRWL